MLIESYHLLYSALEGIGRTFGPVGHKTSNPSSHVNPPPYAGLIEFEHL